VAELSLVAGLGNPGSSYARNRHNVGFMVLDLLSGRAADPAIWKKRFNGEITRFRIGNLDLLLLKPLTYMNLSGRSIARAASFYDLPADRIVVVHDDLDLPLGQIRVKQAGGAGGHHGMESILIELGTDAFCRVRIGIGRPGADSATDHVLSDFWAEEQDALESSLTRAADAVLSLLEDGPRAAMNRFNRRAAPADDEEG